MHSSSLKLRLLSLIVALSLISLDSIAQTTFTSTGSGNFRDNIWSPAVPDFDNISNDLFIINDGDAITLASDISIAALEVGQGGAGATFTIGNDGTGRTLTISGNFTNLSGSTFTVANNGATHTVNVGGDLVNAGSSFVTILGSEVADFVLDGTTTSVISGTAPTFNNLTRTGGGLIVTSTITIAGDFLATGAGTDIQTANGLLFGGNFTLASSATYVTTNSNTVFNGIVAQTIDLSGGSASFNSIIFNNSTKNIIGDLVANGTIEITDDAVVTSTNSNHSIATLEVKNITGVGFTGGTITFGNGELRFGDDTNTDGAFTLGTNVDIIFNGNCSIERDDQVTVDGDVEITSSGFLVLNGTDMTLPAGESDAELNVTGSRTLTIRDNGDIFLRGYDNFPTGFTNYVLETLSLVRYDADFDQLIVGENSANATINFGRIFLSQPDASPSRVRELVSTDDDLMVRGRFNLFNGVTFQFNHAATMTFSESLFMESGASDDPTFNTPNATLILDADINQTVDGPVEGNYTVGEWRITNTATPTAQRRVNIDDNISVNTAFTISNPNGSTANTLIVDLDENQIFGGLGTGENFTLGANCEIYSSTNDPDGFAEGFGEAGDVVSINTNSIVRFDRAGDQSIPNFNGGTFGTIEFAGSGNKFIPFEFIFPTINGVDLTINGDVTRVGGTPVFRFGSIAAGEQRTVNHTVLGDWNMATIYTGDDESAGGFADPSITFAGADQIISSSDFNDVIFAGTGTKTLTGTLLIDGDVSVNDGVVVNAGSEAIDVAGNWTESGTGIFTQTGNTTDFNGGGAQTVSTNSGSTFNDFDITNNSTVTFNSTVQVGRDVDIQNGSSLVIEGQTLRVSRDLTVNSTGTLSYTTPGSSIIIFDGDTEQDIRNINSSQNFPTLQFEGVGNKEIVNNEFTIEGDLTIANESTFQGNNFEINFLGSNWTNNGNFNHNNSVNFLNNGGTTTVSTSTFHDIEVGMSDGTVSTTVELNGNISLNGEMNIFANTTLDVSASNFSVTVEEDWNNYGTFNARQGLVSFIGGRTDFRTLSPTLPNSGAQADKAFYDLNININNEFFIVQENLVVLNDQIDVLNDLNIISGDFRLQEDLVTNTPQLNIGGDFIITNGAISYRQENAKITMNGSSGIHQIDLGGDQVRDFEINASGATYQLINDFRVRDDTDNEFTLTAGTLDLNGNILTINRGGLDMTGGTLLVDEGASLLINDLATNPDFNKTGGDLQILGVDGSPATLSSVDDDGFTFTQTGGDFQAQFYTIAGTSGEGLRIEGGTIDAGNSTGNDFSNGAFTSGIGTAYLTLASLDLNSAAGNISASNVVFNAGPTFNVAVDAGNLPSAGTIQFVIAGGSLAGPQDEDDVPDGGATDGFILWDEDPGFVWTGGGGDSDWNNSANWSIDAGVTDTGGDGIPDPDDLIYLNSGTAPYPVITTTEVAARLTVRSGAAFEISTGNFSVNGNLTVFSGASLTMSDPSGILNVAGAWSNAGMFNEGTATVTFNGTSGTHAIGTLGDSDPFYNLVIDGDGATYTVGSVLTIANSFSLTNGNLDASSGFDIFVNNNWSVNGGILVPGQGRVRFNGTSGTQSIAGGTMFDVIFEGAAQKSIDGNISVADDLTISAASGDVLGNDRTILVGGDWDLDEMDGFVPGTGTVIFNGSATQNIESDDTQALTFNNVIFQNAGVKNLFFNATVNGDFSIIAESTFVDLEAGVTLTIGGTLSQTGGQLRIFDSNFPAAGAYSFAGGEVVFLQDGTISIPGNIAFNDLQIRALADVATTATLNGDITVNDDINLSFGIVTLDVNGHTISLNDGFFFSNNEVLNWNGGTLIHTGAFFNMDVDFNTTDRAFENLILRGTSIKRANSNIAVNGNLTVGEGVELEQLGFTITNDGGDTFTMEADAILDTRVVGVAFPTNFSNYVVDATSRVDLQGTGNQTIFTNSGTLNYGTLRIFTSGTTTLDGDIVVQGDFDMNGNPTLEDGGFNMTLNGATIDIQDYTPSLGTTITFAGSGDQNVRDNDGSGQNLELQNVVFGGSGTKSIFPNAGDEITDIDGDWTIASGVTVTTSRGVEFSGANWTNDGTFNLTVNTRPLILNGGNSTVNPGTNDIASLTVANSAGTTVLVQTNGFDLGTGDFTIASNAAINFGSLTHNMANINFLIDAAGSWVLEDGGGTGATLIFDRNAFQALPVIDETNANITGIPSIETNNAGNKIMQGNMIVDNVVIGSNTDFDANFTENYQITVNGNWTNNGGDFIRRDGLVIFNSDDANPKTIQPAGEQFQAVDFQGTVVRTYTLQGDMSVFGSNAGAGLNLFSATLDLNGNVLTLGNDDTGDPAAEAHIIGMDGTLQVDAGATLQFNTNDDGGDVLETEIGGNLVVQSGGRLSIVGSATSNALVTRSSGFNQIDINVRSGGEVEAEFYNIQFMTDEGFEVEDGAVVDPDGSGHNFSNGTWSNLSTDAGNGTGGDTNPVAGNTYLSIESDAALVIDNVTFNFNGTPTAGQHFNVSRTASAGNNTIDFNGTSGPLGRNGAVFENDGDPTTPADANGQLTWDLPIDTQWTGVTSTDWEDASNWDNGVPSIATNDREAIINLGTPFNPSINGISVNISALIINDGILRLENNALLDLDGDMTLGDGTGGAFIMDNTSTFNVQGSWTTSANGIFDNGNGTVNFDAPSGSSVSVSPGNQNFGNITFSNATAAGEFNMVAGALTIEGNLIIANSAKLIPSSSGYNFNVLGDITATGGEFDTSVDGEIILSGVNQTITDMTFDELTVTGTGTKTSVGTVMVNDLFQIASGATFQGSGAITWNNDVRIFGTFMGVNGETYTFAGDDWQAEANSYSGEGTVVFNRSSGTQFIRQLTNGNFPVEFHHLTLSGNALIQLGRLIAGDQDEGNVDVTGNLTVNNTINTFRPFEYLVDNTSGTGTFTLAESEFVRITGANNFPSNFAVYDLADNSTVRYWGTIDQTIRGAIEYGNVDLLNPTVKTLGDNIDIDGDLIFRNANLDVSMSNFSINLAGRWDTNNGNDDGSFIARDGTVTFDGADNQVLDIGETGNQSFNDILINKGGVLDVFTSDIIILGNLNVFNGTFDINGRTASIGGNINATGTGTFTGGGLYLLNATSGTPTIGTNNSVIPGSIEINAPGRNYELVDDLTLLNNLTIRQGVLDVNGQTLSVGNFEDVLDIFGTLNVSTTNKPGGTLALGNDVQLVVQPGGAINIVGTPSQLATVTSTSNTDYIFSVTGSPSDAGSIGARYYTMEFMGVDGIFVNTNTVIDATNNFSDGTFQNGFSGGRYLRIENTQDLSGGDRIENIVFDDNPGGGATNIFKSTSTSGNIEVFNFTGSFSGENFDEDPNDLITWLAPPTVTWTGIVSSDWFNNGNWDSGLVPTAAQDVIIPQTLNQPVIVDNASVAVANNLTLGVNAIVTITTTDDDIDLRIGGDLVFGASASFASAGTNDDIEVGGSWIRLSSALFTAGTSQVTFNSVAGVESIDENDNFYNLSINITGSISLLTDLNVDNDFTVTAGTFDLATFDLRVGDDFTNGGTINARTQTIYLIPFNTASPKTFSPGTSELYSLVIGEIGGNNVEYDLSSELTNTHDFTLQLGTLDPNGNNLNLGNDDGIQDDVNIAGNLTISTGEVLSLGGDVVALVNSGGDFRLSGADLNNVATLTRRGSSDYDFRVEAGGTFAANNFLIDHVAGEGIWLQASSTLTSLSAGTFSNSNSATQYLRLSNAFVSDITASDITFNVGPTFNVRRNEGAGNNIILQDASGALSGENFDLDDLVAPPGEVIFTFTNPLRVWTGASLNGRFDDTGNWEDDMGNSPVSAPTNANTVQIPDVSGASNSFPVIDNNSGDQEVESITIFPGALLTVTDNRAFDVVSNITNSGTLTIVGSCIVDLGGSWTNNGAFNPGMSTVSMTSATDVTLSGGVGFYNLIIDAAGDGAGIVFSSSSMLDVDNDLTISDGTYLVTDAAHTVNIGGDFVVDDTNGFFSDDLSTVTFDGAAQEIGSSLETATINFNNLVLAGTGTKTLLDAIDVDGDMNLNNLVTLVMGTETLTFGGSNFDVDGTIDVSGGSSSVVFNGAQIQILTSNSSVLTLDNVTINNTAAGSNDVQLNVDLNINDNVNFNLGVIQSSGSNPITFNSGATVSYDGVEETLPIVLPGQDVDGNSYVSGPVIKVGTDDFIFPVGNGTRSGKMAITGIVSGTGTDRFTAEYNFAESGLFDEPVSGGIQRVSRVEFWDLNRSGTGQPLVSLFWDPLSGVSNVNTLTVAHYTGAQWEDEGSLAITGNPSNGTITSANNVNSFSPFTLATTDDEDNPLPVELLFFRGEMQNEGVNLSWATASESENDRFEIERSTDGLAFDVIGEVTGQGTTSQRTDYEFFDNQASFGFNFYRLRQVDFNGDFEYSDIILVDNTDQGVQFDVKIFPNPTDAGNINLQLSTGNETSPVDVRIFDNSGRVFFHREFLPEELNESLRLSTTLQMPTGLYYVEVRQAQNLRRGKLIVR